MSVARMAWYNIRCSSWPCLPVRSISSCVDLNLSAIAMMSVSVAVMALLICRWASWCCLIALTKRFCVAFALSASLIMSVLALILAMFMYTPVRVGVGIVPAWARHAAAAVALGALIVALGALILAMVTAIGSDPARVLLILETSPHLSPRKKQDTPCETVPSHMAF